MYYIFITNIHFCICLVWSRHYTITAVSKEKNYIITIFQYLIKFTISGQLSMLNSRWRVV